MTSKEVSIKLVSRQSDGNTKEETELISAGLYEATEKGYRISYEESEATGFEGSVTTLETEGCRKVTMNRTGTVEANLVVDIGEKQHCVYGTPYGDFMIGITAKTIRSDLDENGGMLFFHYVLDVNSSYAVWPYLTSGPSCSAARVAPSPSAPTPPACAAARI